MSLAVPVPQIVEESQDPLLQKADHWKRVRLGDIAEIQNGSAFSSTHFNKDSEGLPLIRIRDVGSDETESFYSGEYDEQYVVEPGDLLIGMDGDFEAARWHGPKGLLNQRVCRVTVTEDDIYEPKLLDYVLQGYLDAIHRHTSSVTVKHLSSKSVADIPLPWPPLSEQRRIVAKIEELFSNLDAGMDDLQTAGQQLERYRLSVLQAAVEGRLTADWRRTHDPEPADRLLERIRTEKRRLYDRGEIRKPKERPEPEEDEIPFDVPERWNWIRITELMYNWRSGLERRNSDQDPEREYPYVKMGDITNDGRLTLDSVTCVDAEEEDVEKYKLNKGDFLFNVRNSKKLVGKSCVFDVESEETYLFNNNILRVDFGEKVSSKYINYWFCSAAGRDMLEELKSSTTNVAAIYHKDFFTCVVPLPPLAEQKQIVDEVERLLSVADDTAATAERERTRAERLRQSILKQAFSGQLVPHDEDADPPSIDGQASTQTDRATSSSGVSSNDDEEDVVAEELYNGGDPGKQIEMDL